MSLLKLSLSERRALQKQIHNTKDVKVLKRAQALLYLADGVSAQEIAKRLGVTRRTIYGWVSLYQNQRNKSVKDRLEDRLEDLLDARLPPGEAASHSVGTTSPGGV